MNYIKTMLELQQQFNNGIKVLPNAPERDYAFATLVETGEAGDSINFKWWKAGSDDLANFKVELIDIWHFVMSQALEKYSIPHLSEKIYDIFDMQGEYSIHPHEVQDNIKHFLYYILKFDISKKGKALDNALIYLFDLLDYVGITSPEELYQEYLVKNALNHIRQANGYKEGTYIKTWRVLQKLDGIDNQEDNVIAWEILDNLKYQKIDITLDNLKQAMQEYYDTLVKS